MQSHKYIFTTHIHTFTYISRPEDVQSIITGKLALKYAGAQVEAMQYIAKASQDRSVAEFEMV
jgi:26S proteasome regulatory subunit N6